jgi:hypothetical protein
MAPGDASAHDLPARFLSDIVSGCPLTAALLFQLVSLLVSLAMVPLLLRYLGAPEYLVWAIFTTIGGLTLQLESAIQTLMVRRVAPVAAAGQRQQIEAELARARRAYRLLSLAVLLLVLPGGWLYLGWVLQAGGSHAAPDGWDVAWVAFAVAYGINYLFGPNNVWLLATARTNPYFRIGTASRILNFALSLAALLLGFGLAGIAVSFLVSVLVNVGAILLAVRRSRVAEPPAAAVPGSSSVVPDAGAGLWRYTLFTLMGFLLYRGAFLLAVGRFGTGEAAAYGLSLQAIAILGAVAVIPIHVRLHHMVAALGDNDRVRQDVELLRALGFALVAMTGGAAGLALLGPLILDVIGSEVGLPPPLLIALMAAAFLVEAIVLILSGPLLLARDLGFVTAYVVIAALGLMLGALAVLGGAPLGVSLVALPLLLQAGLSLPLLLRALARSRGSSVGMLVRSIGQAFPAAVARG